MAWWTEGAWSVWVVCECARARAWVWVWVGVGGGRGGGRKVWAVAPAWVDLALNLGRIAKAQVAVPGGQLVGVVHRFRPQVVGQAGRHLQRAQPARASRTLGGEPASHPGEVGAGSRLQDVNLRHAPALALVQSGECAQLALGARRDALLSGALDLALALVVRPRPQAICRQGEGGATQVAHHPDPRPHSRHARFTRKGVRHVNDAALQTELVPPLHTAACIRGVSEARVCCCDLQCAEPRGHGVRRKIGQVIVGVVVSADGRPARITCLLAEVSALPLKLIAHHQCVRQPVAQADRGAHTIRRVQIDEPAPWRRCRCGGRRRRHGGRRRRHGGWRRRHGGGRRWRHGGRQRRLGGRRRRHGGRWRRHGRRRWRQGGRRWRHGGQRRRSASCQQRQQRQHRQSASWLSRCCLELPRQQSAQRGGQAVREQ